jgi:peptide/nickel transport system substrate-binding protein
MNSNKNSSKKIISAVFLISLIYLSGCINITEIKPLTKDTLVWGVLRPEQIDALNITIENSWSLIPNIYDSLLEIDNKFRTIPALAVSWSTPDIQTWRFNLRHGVKFHNGEDFTAKDVKFTLEDISNSYYYDTIDNITIVDDYTIQFRTHTPSPAIPSFVYDCIILCKNATPEQGFIGTGPYHIVAFDPGNYTKLEWFEDYWGETPQVKTVYFKAIENTTARLDALLSGEIDIAQYTIDERYQAISQNPNITVVLYPSLNRFIVGFDMRKNESYAFPDGANPTADVRVRKAIYQAINVTQLINGPCNGLAEPLSQLIAPAIFGYNPKISRLPYNLTESKRLLAEAGYAHGFNISVDNIEKGVNIQSSCLIVHQLSKVGINVTLTNLSFLDFDQKVMVNRNTSMYLVGYGGSMTVDGGTEYNYFIQSVSENTGSLNSGYYSNPEVDRLGIESSQEMSPVARLKLLQEGFRIALVDDIAYVPLFNWDNIILTANNVNFSPYADQYMIVKDITFT